MSEVGTYTAAALLLPSTENIDLTSMTSSSIGFSHGSASSSSLADEPLPTEQLYTINSHSDEATHAWILYYRFQSVLAMSFQFTDKSTDI